LARGGDGGEGEGEEEGREVHEGWMLRAIEVSHL
jgi:hypothetical protein